MRPDVRVVRRARLRSLLGAGRRPWAGRLSEPLLLEPLEQQAEREVEDRLQIARRVAVSHEVLDAFELRFERGRDCELDAVPRRRERLDLRTDRGRERRGARSRWRHSGRPSKRRRRKLRRDGLDARHHVRSREARSDRRLDLARGLARRFTKKLLMVLVREMGSKRVERTEMNLAALEEAERERESRDDAGRGDPSLRFARAHPELANAEVPHRRARVLGVQSPVLHLGEIRDQARLPDVPVADVRVQPRKQLLVRQIL